MAGESKLQEKIIAYLNKNGWDVNKRMVMSHNGWCDLECLKSGGLFIEIEVKDKGEKPDPIQQYWIDRHSAMGHISFYVDTFEMFIEKYNSYHIIKSVEDLTKIIQP